MSALCPYSPPARISTCRFPVDHGAAIHWSTRRASADITELPSSASQSVSQGGSAWFHDKARVGTLLQVSLPVNDMALVEEASLSVFIAGGIGITPPLSMIERLQQQGSQ